MTSFRKKYRPNFESPIAGNEPPVSVPPEVTAAELPSAVEPKPIEQLESDPVRDSEQSAIRQRLAELERAEKLVQGAAQHQQQRPEPPQQPQPQPQQPLTVEQMLANSGLPERAQNWLRQHPDYVTNPAKLNRLGAVEELAREQVGSQWMDEHFDRIEEMLGFKRVQPNAGSAPMAAPTPAPPRNVAPPRQRSAIPVSAPPSRDSMPSLATGRPVGDVRLSADELDIARTLGLSPQRYMEEKKRMLQLRAEGKLDDRR